MATAYLMIGNAMEQMTVEMLQMKKVAVSFISPCSRLIYGHFSYSAFMVAM